MRKIIKCLVVFLFIVSAALLIFGMISRTEKNRQISERIKKLPSFSLMTLTNGSFNSSEIKTGPLLVVRFHPECEHCRYEISEIMKSNITVSGARVILVSSADADSIRKFLSPYNLSDYPSIKTLVDTSYIFGDIFGSDVVPSNYVYNKELELVKVLFGEVKTETIFRYLQGGDENK